MNKIYKNELDLTEWLVKNLLNQQCAEYSNLNLAQIPSGVTVHALFRLGEQYVICLPRIGASIGIFPTHLSPRTNGKFVGFGFISKHTSCLEAESVKVKYDDSLFLRKHDTRMPAKY